MALYRKVLTNLWGDVWFENAGVASKLLYLYALTCDRTTPAGMYRISRQRLAFETHLTDEQLSGALAELEGAEKLYFDDAAGVLWAPDFRLYNDSTSPAWLTGLHNAVMATPDCGVKDRYLEMYPLAQMPLLDPQVTVTGQSLDPQVTVGRPSLQQEQEHQHQQEQEKENQHQHQQPESSIKRKVVTYHDPFMQKTVSVSADSDPPSGVSDSDRLTDFPEGDADLIREALEFRDKAQDEVTKGKELDQMFDWAEQYGAQALWDAAHKAWKYTAKNPGAYMRTVLESGENGRDDP